jgi:hypothetical protein
MILTMSKTCTSIVIQGIDTCLVSCSFWNYIEKNPNHVILGIIHHLECIGIVDMYAIHSELFSCSILVEGFNLDIANNFLAKEFPLYTPFMYRDTSAQKYFCVGQIYFGKVLVHVLRLVISIANATMVERISCILNYIYFHLLFSCINALSNII